MVYQMFVRSSFIISVLLLAVTGCDVESKESLIKKESPKFKIMCKYQRSEALISIYEDKIVTEGWKLSKKRVDGTPKPEVSHYAEFRDWAAAYDQWKIDGEIEEYRKPILRTSVITNVKEFDKHTAQYTVEHMKNGKIKSDKLSIEDGKVYNKNNQVMSSCTLM